MANKVAALLVICIILEVVIQLPTAVADNESCVQNCNDECISEGKTTSFCDVKCHTDCFGKDVSSGVNALLPTVEASHGDNGGSIDIKVPCPTCNGQPIDQVNILLQMFFPLIVLLISTRN